MNLWCLRRRMNPWYFITLLYVWYWFFKILWSTGSSRYSWLSIRRISMSITNHRTSWSSYSRSNAVSQSMISRCMYSIWIFWGMVRDSFSDHDISQWEVYSAIRSMDSVGWGTKTMSFRYKRMVYTIRPATSHWSLTDRWVCKDWWLRICRCIYNAVLES